MSLTPSLFPPTFDLNPTLTSAIERWQTTATEMTEDLSQLENALNPMQTFVQKTTNTYDYLSNVDWMTIMTAAEKPSLLREVFEEYTDLQTSALQRITSDQEALIDTITANSRSAINNSGSLHDPQAMCAHYLDKSLDTLLDIKTNVENQMQTASSINAAFSAWYQQSLDTLSKQ